VIQTRMGGAINKYHKLHVALYKRHVADITRESSGEPPREIDNIGVHVCSRRSCTVP
jgi:hypothetical protein